MSLSKVECVFIIAVVKAILLGQCGPPVGTRVHQYVGDTSHQGKLVVSAGEILRVLSKDGKAQLGYTVTMGQKAKIKL